MTIHEIAQEAYDSLSTECKGYIARYVEQELPILYFGIGAFIYSKYLYDKPKPDDTTNLYKHDISREIIRAIWVIAKSERIQAEQETIFDIAS